VVWNSKGSQLADIVEKYVKKGEKLYVEGRIEYRQWQDKDGQTKYSTEINVRELLLLGGKRDGMGGADFDSGGSYGDGNEGAAPRRSAAPAPARERQGAGAPAARNGGAKGPAKDDFEDFPGALEDEDDDLPF
jgi:single-strand DNA-binding protein